MADAVVSKKSAILITVLLSVAVLTVMGSTTRNPFLLYEDWLFVTRNPVVQAGLTWRGVEWAFSTYLTGHWYPLTWLSHMLDAHLYGLNARGHHLTNVLLHWTNTLLLFWFLVLTTRWSGRSAWVAALFAIHPLHVESVAWISERKDVLSTFFWLLTMLAYYRYVRSKSLVSYFSVVVIFICGLMSKPMLVTLPCVLFLLDLWPFRRLEEPRCSLRRIVGEKIPLLCLSAVFSVVSVIAQRSADALAGLHTTPLDARFKNSILAYVVYLKKAFLPFDLAIFYPYPTAYELASWKVGAALVVLTTVSVIALQFIRAKPYLTFGWCWYLGTLVPVIGLVQVGSQAYADRYTYVPLIGIFLAAVWEISDLVSQSKVAKRLAALIGLCFLLLFAILTRRQIALWRDDVSLFRHTIASTRDNYIAENLLGLGYVGQGQHQEARTCFERAVTLEPHFADGHNNLGMVLLELGRLDAAKQSFQQTIRLNPKMAKAYLNLGGVFFEKGDYEAAASNYLEALGIDPSYVAAHRNLGITYESMGRYKDALQSFERAVALHPADSISRHHMALVASRLMPN
jgi:tetratricopeptide (TPR) repeat protein